MKILKELFSRTRTEHRRYTHALLMLLICSLSLGLGQSHAQVAEIGRTATQTSDMTRARIVLGNSLYDYRDPGDKEMYLSCRDIDQLVSWSEPESKIMSLWCGHITVNGVKPEMHDAGKSFDWLAEHDDFHEPNGHYAGMTAPLDTVITAEGYKVKDVGYGWTGWRQASFSKLTLDGKTLMVQPREWTSGKSGCPDAATVGYRNSKDGPRVLCADVYLVNRPPAAEAHVIAVHWKTRETCAIRVPTNGAGQKHYFLFEYKQGQETEDKLWPPCTSNTTESIAFEKVPSATRILLTDYADCGKEDSDPDTVNAFWIELRTTAKSVTLDPIPLHEIFTYGKGDIVRPGLQLVDYYLKSGQTASRKLSCIKIETSAAPPSA